METIELIKEEEEIQRERERRMRKAAEIIKRRPKDSTFGGNPNPCKLTIPKRKRKKP